MILGLFGHILYSYVVQQDVEKPHGLLNHKELCTHTPKKQIWIYGVEQPDLLKSIEDIWTPSECVLCVLSKVS